MTSPRTPNVSPVSAETPGFSGREAARQDGAKRPDFRCAVRRAPGITDEQATDNFVEFAHLLVQLRAKYEARGHIFLDADGVPLPPLGYQGGMLSPAEETTQ